jgi:DNA repair protein RAD16
LTPGHSVLSHLLQFSSDDDISSDDESEDDAYNEDEDEAVAPFLVEEETVDAEGVNLSSSLLHKIHWRRIVLDEAHKIKGRVNNTAKSVYAVVSTRRWALTGTPLQNRVGELYALIRFLRMEPFAYYFCKKKGCECKSLHWQMGHGQRGCETCGHPPMSHYSYFNKSILNPIKL